VIARGDIQPNARAVFATRCRSFAGSQRWVLGSGRMLSLKTIPTYGTNAHCQRVARIRRHIFPIDL
jgi:hypothetical protein